MKTARDFVRPGGVFRMCLILVPLVLFSLTSRAQDQEAPDQPVSVHPASPPDAVPEDAQSRWEAQSVRELMQEDLRAALQTQADGTAGIAPARVGQGPGIRPVLEPRLVALYGVGSALMAEVQVGRHAYLYVRGQAWPAGHVGDRGVYQLRGMNGACVQLERGEDRHSLCLRMLLGEVRP